MDANNTLRFVPVFQTTIDVTHRYLYIPVRNTGSKYTIQLTINGKVAREFSVELALADPPDWWAFYDISAFQNQKMELRITQGDELPPDAILWIQQAIRQGDDLPGMEGVYHETYRPQFHFTARRGWNNDPNGLVYHAGEWHMYYQHNPFGTRWGNMHWGHAVSRDLVHWDELPEALYQNSLNDMAFSGGGLVDQANTAGFQQGAEEAIVVSFTSTGRGECLAYSNDRGRTLTEWEGNPFLKHQGRDPKIIWSETLKNWIMIVYEELAAFDELQDDQRGYAFYSSTDLKNWVRHSFLAGFYECPEIFQLRLNNQPQETLWVLHGCLWQSSPSTCLIGNFDGRNFSEIDKNVISHYGPQFYAAQVFSNAPDDRVIMIGWLVGAEYPGMSFSQGMTVPLELSLRITSTGVRLCYFPVKELETLRLKTIKAENLTLEQANELLTTQDSELLDVELISSISEPMVLNVRGFPIYYHHEPREISFAGKTAKLPDGETQLSLRILVDRCVTEVFVNDGLAAFASLTLFADPIQPLQISGCPTIQRLVIHKLSSIWK